MRSVVSSDNEVGGETMRSVVVSSDNEVGGELRQ